MLHMKMRFRSPRAAIAGLFALALAGCDTPYEVPERTFRANVGDTIAVIALTESLAPQFDASPGANRTASVGTERLRLDRVEIDNETGTPSQIRMTRIREMTRDATNVSASYLVTPMGGRNFAEAGVGTSSRLSAAAYGAGGTLDDAETPVFLSASENGDAFPTVHLGHVEIEFVEVSINSVRYSVLP